MNKTYIKVESITSVLVETENGKEEVLLEDLPENIAKEVRLLNDLRMELVEKEYEVKKLMLALNSQQSVLNLKIRNELNKK